jgi:hypothetical protein
VQAARVVLLHDKAGFAGRVAALPAGSGSPIAELRFPSLRPAGSGVSAKSRLALYSPSVRFVGIVYSGGRASAKRCVLEFGA